MARWATFYYPVIKNRPRTTQHRQRSNDKVSDTDAAALNERQPRSTNNESLYGGGVNDETTIGQITGVNVPVAGTTACHT